MIKVSPWPIFASLSVEVLMKLMEYQYDHHGTALEEPPQLPDLTIDTKPETPEEIDRLMRQAPSRSRE